MFQTSLYIPPKQGINSPQVGVVDDNELIIVTLNLMLF
jgi:hypothetical protein